MTHFHTFHFLIRFQIIRWAGSVLLNPAPKITIWLVTGSNAHIVPPRSSEVILRSPPTTPELLCTELVGKECADHHQKIVYFPAEFFLGMTVKRKRFFLSSSSFRCLRLLSAILTLTPVLLMLVATKIFVSLMGVIIFALLLLPINVFTVLKF